ncbi:MAG TPA: hypothetical protein VNF75_02635 [Candidatus Dormibacteraeota bacterium]|nr:hypothetical protein [Candidatus Dormibacteraeota bacterium]
MADPRSGVAEALIQGPTWFLARGEPGLGRLMETISLAGIVAAAQRSRRVRVATSSSAVAIAERLVKGRVDRLDLGGGDDLQQALIDSEGVQRLLERVSRCRPAAIVVDGYPILLPLLRQVSDARLVVLANLHDLRNPAHSQGARLLQEALHVAADLIVISELRRGWTHGRVQQVPLLRIPALVRTDALRKSRPVGVAQPYVAVLGGGSRGDLRLAQSTQAILEALDRAVAAHVLPGCHVYAGTGINFGPGRYRHLVAGDPVEGIRALTAARLVVVRAGRSTLAEILASQRAAVVVAAESDTLRGAEQVSNAAAAAALSPAVVPMSTENLGDLGARCRQALSATPAAWRPGNDSWWRALQAIGV